jgi:hypothetical protein
MTYEPIITEGIKHLVGRNDQELLDLSVKGYYLLLQKEPSKVHGPLSNLHLEYKSRALLVWYRDKDLRQCKENAFVAAMVRRLIIQDKPAAEYNAQASGLLYPLLSDNEDMMHWHKQFMLPLFLTLPKKNPRGLDLDQYEYHDLQARLVLQGEWDLLIDRCEKRLATPPKKNKLYLIDYEFYLALARGDTVSMEESLSKLLSPKVARHRNREMCWGLEERLLSAWGFIFAKIAWRVGYQVQVDSPWLPQECLPVEPLDEYPLPYDFLKNFDLFKQFDDNPKSWCKNASNFSPRCPGEPSLNYQEILDHFLHI